MPQVSDSIATTHKEGGLRSLLRGPCPLPAQPGRVSRRTLPDSGGVLRLVYGWRIRGRYGVGRGFCLRRG